MEEIKIQVLEIVNSVLKEQALMMQEEEQALMMQEEEQALMMQEEEQALMMQEEEQALMMQEEEEDLRIVGMDSIAFIHLIVALEEIFDVEIPDEFLLMEKMNTINKIAEIVVMLIGEKMQFAYESHDKNEEITCEL